MRVVPSVNPDAAGSMEELDEDVVVASSQTNYTCPLTQVDHSSVTLNVSNISILSELYLISDINMLVSVSARCTTPECDVA